MNCLIKNGKIVNPATDFEDIGYIVIVNDTVAELKACDELSDTTESALQAKYGIEKVIDASGKIVMPGLIDMHVHFRDPGQTAKEDIATGSAAAVAGGVTTVLAMANTSPVVDSAEGVRYVHEKAASVGLCNVLQVGAVTLGMKGETCCDYAAMKAEGMVAISEDGKSVMDSGVYRKAMRSAAELDLTVLAHCEDINIVEGGCLNAGAKADKIGVGGISNAVENIIEVRDIMLAEETGARLHLCHCSTAESYDIVKGAKERGIAVSAEVCPHHFSLCEDDITADDANYKMNPPLRTATDRDALIKGLSEGIFEVISTDHAPHTAEEKSRGIASAPFGIVGLETSLALTYTNLVLPGHISLRDMACKMSYNPARILKIDRGDISAGHVADIVIFNPDESYEINPDEFAGKGRNTPFFGTKVTGRVEFTMHEGRIVYSR